jgi:uncharacterized protein YdeI (YjbR/CyaY-like superfamily)
MADDLPELLVADAAGWRDWLTEHHATSPGVWLVLHRKGGDVTALTYAEAVDQALCFGWIDGQRRSRDAATSLQRMTPRGPRSMWSARNVGIIERLERDGLMHEAGRAAVRAAQQDGRWDKAYAGPATATVPPDLAAAVAANPAAQAMFDVLHRLGTIKGAQTRRRRIEAYVEMLARQETPYPQKRRP